MIDGLQIIPSLAIDHTFVVPGSDVFRIHIDNFIKISDGLSIFLLLIENNTSIIPGIDAIRVDLVALPKDSPPYLGQGGRLEGVGQPHVGRAADRHRPERRRRPHRVREGHVPRARRQSQRFGVRRRAVQRAREGDVVTGERHDRS